MHSIIINRLSGGGAAARWLHDIEALLRSRAIDYRVDVTERPGDGYILARKAVEDGLDGVIAMGGDGTFSEVANGLGESGLEMLFAPCGTGNDFMRMFSLPKNPLKALEKQLSSPERRIDMGKCNDRYFLNVTGCGFDVDVLAVVEKYREKSSSLGAYLRGAYTAIRNYKPMKVQISVDGGELREEYVTIVSVGNGAFIGGGMKALPGAQVDDGLFNLMIFGPVNRITIYMLLLLFFAGKHPIIRGIVRMQKCRCARIIREGLMLEADGEVFSCDDVTLTIIPGGLRTRLPE